MRGKGGTCNFHQKNQDDQMILANKDVNVTIKDSDLGEKRKTIPF